MKNLKKGVTIRNGFQFAISGKSYKMVAFFCKM